MSTDGDEAGESETEPDAVPDQVEFVRFRVGEGRYAVELGNVQQVVRRPAVTRVPRAPPAIRGVTNVGGDVTVVLDSHQILDEVEGAIDGVPALVLFDVDRTDHATGVYVDDVEGIETVPVDDVAPVADADWEPADPGLFRAVLTGDDPAGVLDPARLAATAAVR